MKKQRYYLIYTVHAIIIIFFVISSISCTQYDYSSPLPGIIEIHLRTISSPDKIPFEPLNAFVIKISSVEAIRANQTRVLLYEDAKAIKPSTNTYNTLDFRARDSTLVIGQGYGPPGEYIGVNLLIEPGQEVILHGYQHIKVSRPEGFNPLLTSRKPFQVKESLPTVITLTIDLDASLVKGAYTYTFNPLYYISSIQ